MHYLLVLSRRWKVRCVSPLSLRVSTSVWQTPLRIATIHQDTGRFEHVKYHQLNLIIAGADERHNSEHTQKKKKTNKQKTFSCIKLKFHNRAIARSFRYAWLDEKCRQMTEQNTMNRHNIHCDKRSFATNGDVPSAEWERERGWTLLVTR